MHSIANLPPSVTRTLFADLFALLPPPVPDTPDARAARQDAAVAAVASLHPGDAIEADLAVQIVGAQAHAKECLRVAAASADPAEARRNRAQAALMMRQMQSGMRLLQRRQAERDKALVALHPGAMERAGYWFNCLMNKNNGLWRYNRHIPG